MEIASIASSITKSVSESVLSPTGIATCAVVGIATLSFMKVYYPQQFETVKGFALRALRSSILVSPTEIQAIRGEQRINREKQRINQELAEGYNSLASALASPEVRDSIDPVASPGTYGAASLNLLNAQRIPNLLARAALNNA